MPFSASNGTLTAGVTFSTDRTTEEARGRDADGDGDVGGGGRVKGDESRTVTARIVGGGGSLLDTLYR